MPAEPVRLTWPAQNAPNHEGPTPTLRTRRRGEGASLIRGDNLAALRALHDRGDHDFTLVYMDPPFFTGKQHHRVHRARDARGNISRTLSPAFDDRWSSLSDYLAALRPRVAAAKRLLNRRGSFVLHVDSKTSHYCKVLCDEVFGPDCFASEIIWRYRRWPSKTKNFQRVHDVLLRYTSDPTEPATFNQLYEPLAASTLATWGTRKQRAVVDSAGRRTRSSKTAAETPGAPLGDVWDIGIVAPVSRERTGYPTQKPEALLERLVLACTNEGDRVLDPYMGSGTTLAVAARLARDPVGIDIGPDSLEIAMRRLTSQGIKPRVEHVVMPRLARSRPSDRDLLATG